MDLRAIPHRDTDARKEWYLSYVNLTKFVNWMKAESPAVLVPPYSAGAAVSRLDSLLESGHDGNISLSREAKDKLRSWMDLAVPFSGEYTEGMYDAGDIARYNAAIERRRQWKTAEQEALEALAGRTSLSGRRAARPSPRRGAVHGIAQVGRQQAWRVYRLDGTLVRAGRGALALRDLLSGKVLAGGVLILHAGATCRISSHKQALGDSVFHPDTLME